MKIFKQIDLINGDKIEIIQPTFWDMSRIMQKYQNQLKEDEALDPTPFFAQHLCLFNGKKKDLKFIFTLSSDIYFLISEQMGIILTPLR